MLIQYIFYILKLQCCKYIRMHFAAWHGMVWILAHSLQAELSPCTCGGAAFMSGIELSRTANVWPWENSYMTMDIIYSIHWFECSMIFRLTCIAYLWLDTFTRVTTATRWYLCEPNNMQKKHFPHCSKSRNWPSLKSQSRPVVVRCGMNLIYAWRMSWPHKEVGKGR